MTESLPLMLKELRLSAFGQYYENYQAQAIEQSWGYTQYLATLCEQEVARRFQTRVHNWTKEARLPRGKSFATLVVNELPKTIHKKVIGLRDNTQWALQADNVLLIGPFWRRQVSYCCCLGSSPDRAGCPGEMVAGHGIGTAITAGQKGSGLNGHDEQIGQIPGARH